MKYLNQFSIPIQSIEIGLHTYKFIIEDEFFSHYENSPIDAGKYEVELILEKKENEFVLNFHIDGSFNTPCDRCLAKIDIQTSIDKLIWVKYSDQNRGEVVDEDVILIEEGDSVFNASDLIFEFITLSLPMARTYDCENDPNPKCDFEVLKYLEKEIEKSEGNSFADELKKISEN